MVGDKLKIRRTCAARGVYRWLLLFVGSDHTLGNVPLPVSNREVKPQWVCSWYMVWGVLSCLLFVFSTFQKQLPPPTHSSLYRFVLFRSRLLCCFAGCVVFKLPHLCRCQSERPSVWRSTNGIGWNFVRFVIKNGSGLCVFSNFFFVAVGLALLLPIYKACWCYCVCRCCAALCCWLTRGVGVGAARWWWCWWVDGVLPHRDISTTEYINFNSYSSNNVI